MGLGTSWPGGHGASEDAHCAGVMCRAGFGVDRRSWPGGHGASEDAHCAGDGGAAGYAAGGLCAGGSGEPVTGSSTGADFPFVLGRAGVTGMAPPTRLSSRR